MTLIVAGSIRVAIALLAALSPQRHALRVSPSVALRDT
jgi:hypothetical protein